MRRHALPLLLFACAACQAPDPRASGSAGINAPAPLPTLEEQVAEAARASQPGSAHRKLDPLVGDWQIELASVAEDQREEPLAHGEAHIEWVHGQRYLAWSARLDPAGTTSGFLGYDLSLQQYQLLMINSLSSSMGVASGYGDIAGQGIRFTRESLAPTLGRRVRETCVLRLLDPSHFVLDAYGIDPAGHERVVRRTHYRRASVKR